jgi:hypothetical protein
VKTSGLFERSSWKDRRFTQDQSNSETIEKLAHRRVRNSIPHGKSGPEERSSEFMDEDEPRYGQRPSEFAASKTSGVRSFDEFGPA